MSTDAGFEVALTPKAKMLLEDWGAGPLILHQGRDPDMLVASDRLVASDMLVANNHHTGSETDTPTLTHASAKIVVSKIGASDDSHAGGQMAASGRLRTQGRLVVTGDSKAKGRNIVRVSVKNIQQALLVRDVWGITGLEFASPKDGMHHYHSTFNQVLAKLAKQHWKAVIFLLSDIHDLGRDSRGAVLGRLSQNISLCKKYGVTWYLWSGARNSFDWVSPRSRIAFAKTLGASSEQAAKAVSFPISLKERG